MVEDCLWIALLALLVVAFFVFTGTLVWTDIQADHDMIVRCLEQGNDPAQCALMVRS